MCLNLVSQNSNKWRDILPRQLNPTVHFLLLFLWEGNLNLSYVSSEVLSSKQGSCYLQSLGRTISIRQLAPKGFDSSHRAFGQLFLKPQPWGKVLPNQAEVMLPLRPAECPSLVTVGVTKVSFCAATPLLWSILRGEHVGRFPWPYRPREGKVPQRELPDCFRFSSFGVASQSSPQPSCSPIPHPCFVLAPLPHIILLSCLWHAHISSLHIALSRKKKKIK